MKINTVRPLLATVVRMEKISVLQCIVCKAAANKIYKNFELETKKSF